MSDAELFEQARVFLPKYLSPESQHSLWEALRAFPDNRFIYSPLPMNDDVLLQGDGWRGFVAVDFHTLTRKTVSGVIISNSCDVSTEHTRAIRPTVLFAPTIKLADYVELLGRSGQSEQQIGSACASIRAQKITSIFYCPAIDPIAPERIVLLSDIHGHPLDDFIATERSRLFSLNQFGFYLFLFKLSIHLTRMQEDLPRG